MDRDPSLDVRPPAAPIGLHQPPATPYRFTSEEMRVLRECNRNSFFQRCIPISTLLGVGTYYAVQSGYMKPHPRWGASIKVTVAVILGYFVGKFSYQSKCAEMIMQLPNSQLGEMLRKRKKQGGFQEAISMDSSLSLPSFGDVDSYSDVTPHHEIDMDRPYQAGLDDSQRLTLDSPSFKEDNLSLGTPPKSITTYEELRRRNREEYEQKKTKQFRGVMDPDDVPTTVRPKGPLSEPSPNPPLAWNREKNQYGDVWEK